MKIEVEIPEGKNCTKCLFCYEHLDSFNYEESHNHCAYLDECLNDDTVWPSNKRIKKHPNCPALR